MVLLVVRLVDFHSGTYILVEGERIGVFQVHLYQIIKVEGFEIKIMSMQEHRIDTVKLTKLPD